MKNNIVILLCISLFPLILHGQQAILSSGGDASGSGGSVAYSLGQVANSFQSSANGDINQGVQQAYEIYTVGVSDASGNFSLTVYPNPANDELNLFIEDFSGGNYEYYLFAVDGKLLMKDKVLTANTRIDLSAHSQALYLLKVSSDQKELRTFKIVKN